MHIYFVDPMFIPCSPYSASYQIVHFSLIELHIFSGLQLNQGKSRVYFDGFADHEKAALCGLLGFQCGPLPVRYLRVPLIFTKLTASESLLLQNSHLSWIR